MSDEWDFYFAKINDTVSSIFVDLGLKPDAPNEKRPWLLWVWVEMLAPRPDGLSSGEEAPKLHEIEESLNAMIPPVCGAQLVGRITGSNRREFYFYGEEPGELDAAVGRTMQAFPDYRFQSGSKFEPEWEQYLELLYPSASNLQRMMNRRVLDALGKNGDVHEMPRKVDHWFEFATPEARTPRAARSRPSNSPSRGNTKESRTRSGPSRSWCHASTVSTCTPSTASRSSSRASRRSTAATTKAGRAP